MRAASAAPMTPSVTAASTSPFGSPIESAPPATSRIRVRRFCVGRCLRPPSAPPGAPHPTTPTTWTSPSGSTTTAPASRSRANSAGAPTTSCANSATRALSEGAVSSFAVVQDFDVVEDLGAQLGLCRPGAAVDQLLLQRREEALGDGVVEAVAFASHRLRDAGGAGLLAEGEADELPEFNRSSQHSRFAERIV